ncbi:MAG: glycosyltransferase family 4 protein [Candidatus Thorarchaeota archaeon]
MSREKNQGRILIISQYYPPDLGGSATRAANLTKALISEGYDVDVITAVPHYPDGSTLPLRDCKLFRWSTHQRERRLRFWMPPVSHNTSSGRLLNYLFFMFAAFLGILLTPKPRAILALSPNFFCWFTGLFGKLFRRVPLVINIDDLWPEALLDLNVVQSTVLTKLIQMTRRYCFALASAILCISQVIAEFVKKNILSHRNVYVVEVGFDFNQSVSISRASNDEADSIIRVVYSGILGSAYAFDFLIQLAIEFQKRNHRYRILLKGKGPESARLNKIITNLNLSNIQLVEEWMNIEDYHKFMNHANVFILPMRDNFISTTALPTKFIEYMAYGKPVIVVGSGEVARIVKDAACGLATNLAGYDEVVRFLENIERNPDMQRTMGDAGKSYAKTHFSIASISKKVNEVISNL